MPEGGVVVPFTEGFTVTVKESGGGCSALLNTGIMVRFDSTVSVMGLAVLGVPLTSHWSNLLPEFGVAAKVTEVPEG